jgi:hypothetical protein
MLKMKPTDMKREEKFVSGEGVMRMGKKLAILKQCVITDLDTLD